MEGLPMELNDARIPIKIWAFDVEEDALNQARNAANHLFSFHHIALMPDVHSGYGLPVGGVAALEGVIIPYAIGVDIGCGMRAIKTSLIGIEANVLKKIKDDIEAVIPVGFGHNKTRSDLPSIDRADFELSQVLKNEWQSAAYQIGSLGGGNHFIEIQEDESGYLWVMIHSGSRNIGNKVATHFNQEAVRLNEEWSWDIKIPKSNQLAFLPLVGKNKHYGETYMREMNWCLEFAKTSRKMMMEKVMVVFENHFLDVSFENELDVHHNYASLENHFGKNVMVHRKGATSAKLNEFGIIPGCQGTSSYIVKGLGNQDSFQSCSHGAGRKLSRTKARNILDLEEEKKKLDDQGIIHSINDRNDLDESSGAYKDIETVLEYEEDLVSVVQKLVPRAVVKG